MSADAMPKHASLVEALAAAQGEFGPIGRNRVGQEGNRKFKYVDLSAILAAVTPALSRHGIAHTTRFDTDPSGATVLVSELHHGAETLASRLPVAVTGVSIMQAGKNITYLRRYVLQALLDVCPDDEDQDGDDLGDARQPPVRQHDRQQAREPASTAAREPASTNGRQHESAAAREHAGDAPPALANGRGWSVTLPGETKPFGPLPLQDAWAVLYRACKGEPNADGLNAAEIQEAKDVNRALYDAVTPKAKAALDELLVQRSPKVA